MKSYLITSLVCIVFLRNFGSAETVSICAQGTDSFCKIDPCSITKCPTFPQAICKRRPCGGCNVDFLVEDKIVFCDPITPPPHVPCAYAVPLVFCFVNPCQVAVCPAFPNAICYPTYCGSCKANFYVNNQLVMCDSMTPYIPVTRP